MKVTKALFALAMLVASIAQAAPATEQPSAARASQPTIALDRYAPVLIDGHKQTIYGPDRCDDDLPGCTILTGKQSVDVRLSSGVVERWKVTWSTDGQRVSLTRPNGEIVSEDGSRPPAYWQVMRHMRSFGGGSPGLLGLVD
ncbi:hypothetical protein [Burkholderia sp. Tr-20390]|uniref:hypothetical protein n=1 Tax=Burkholderia sp. Tr-20390 TaxID=2703904 RepID=UPI00197E712D|nr:hypothetical protein [Burkholderia sp. Tr-20390]MBN3733148.1 hypothetical protein [Burkholderia sp. Tr-20390]